MISKSLVLRRLCRGWTSLDAQVPEQGGHVGPEVFVVLVDGGQPGRDMIVPADLDTGQNRGDDVVPEGEQRRYGPGGRAGQVVAPGSAGFADELLAAEFAHRWAAGEVPAVGRVLFQRPPVRTTRASFPA